MAPGFRHCIDCFYREGNYIDDRRNPHRAPLVAPGIPPGASELFRSIRVLSFGTSVVEVLRLGATDNEALIPPDIHP
jgi:hypothetical protein